MAASVFDQRHRWLPMLSANRLDRPTTMAAETFYRACCAWPASFEPHEYLYMMDHLDRRCQPSTHHLFLVHFAVLSLKQHGLFR